MAWDHRAHACSQSHYIRSSHTPYTTSPQNWEMLIHNVEVASPSREMVENSFVACLCISQQHRLIRYTPERTAAVSEDPRFPLNVSKPCIIAELAMTCQLYLPHMPIVDTF